MGKIRAILILAVLGGEMYPFSVQAQQSQPTLQISPSTVSVSVTGIQAANSAIILPVVFAVTGSPPPARINPNVAGVGTIPPGLYFPGYPSSYIAEPTPNNPTTLNSRVEINSLIVAALSKTTTYRVEYTATNPSGSATAVLLITVIVSGTTAQQQSQNQGGPQQTFQQQWQQLQQQQLGSRIQWQGAPSTILRRRFNPKSGRVEVTKNGVITRKGYLNLMGKNLNRRQTLRNYRYR